MLSINTNINGLKSSCLLFGQTNSLSQKMQRLSSGLRINSAKDDAASLSISQKIVSQSNGLEVANRNIQTAISMVDTAES